jgi:hypothetical protein
MQLTGISQAATVEPSLMTSFLIGAAGSLVASLIILLATWLFTRRFRENAIRLILRLLGVGIEFVHPNQGHAQESIVSELKRSERIRILSIRGRSIADGYLSFLLREPPFRQVQILVADPDTPTDYNPVILRALEVRKAEPKVTPELYLEEGRQALRMLYGWNSNQHLAIKAYQFPAVFRIVATEGLMFLSFYPAIGSVRERPIFCIPAHSAFYKMMCKYFDHIWEDPRSREPVKYGERAPEPGLAGA